MFDALQSFKALSHRIAGYLSLQDRRERRTTSISGHMTAWMRGLLAVLFCALFTMGASYSAEATTFTETVPNGHGPIPNTYPPVGGTMFVLVGANGNLYYQFVNPSTQFVGFAGTGTPTAFQGIPVFQLGPQQTLNCGIVSCSDYFGGSIAEGYSRLTVRDADACPGNFDYQDVSYEVNGLSVGSLSDLPAGSVERTNFAGTTTIGTEDCFRNQGNTETSTAWFDLPGNLLSDILSTGGTTPFIRDDDTGTNTTRGDNFWFFTDGNDATGTPEVAPGITIEKTADVTSYSAVGDIINYDFEITNIGSVTLNGIVVIDTFITGTISCPQTSLVTGASMVCTAEHIVSQQNIDDDDIFVNTAEVSANPTEGQLGAVSGTLTIPGPAANNSMTITKVADNDTDVVVGDVITYSYTVQNTGNVTLDNVNITDVHGGSGTLSVMTPLSVDDLGPNDTQVFTATYTVTQADIDAGGTIDNTATANSTPKRGTITAPTADESISVTAPQPEALFSKLASPDADLDTGDTVTYTYTVENTGNVTLNDVSITDAHGGSGTLSAITPATASIAPNASASFTATYIVTQADFDAGIDIANTATMSATPAGGTLANLNADETISLNAPAPASTLSKTASNDTDVAVGEVITYSYVFTNTGNTTLSDISVSDVHNGNGALSAITPASVASLAPNASASFTASYTVTQADIDAGSVTNVAFATDGTVTSAPDIVTVSGTQALAYSLNKVALSTGFTAVGDILSYDYIITNSGNVTLTGTLTIADDKIGEVTCPPLGAEGLLPNASQTCSADYVVTQADIDLGEVTNIAIATIGGNAPTEPDSATIVGTQIRALSIVKTANETSYANVGDVITYNYRVTNTGNVSITNAITVSDDKIESVSCPNANQGLAPSQTLSCSADYIITQADLNAGELTNVASASDGTITSAHDSVTIEAEIIQGLEIVKRAVTDSYSVPGDILAYEYEVTNIGNTTLTSAVTISDDKIAAVSCPQLPDGFDPQTTILCTADYAVTQSDIDNGEIVNLAQAESGDIVSPEVAETVIATREPELTVTKTVTNFAQAFGPLYDVTYQIVMQNTGNVTLSSLSLEDDLAAFLAPATIHIAPVTAISGFTDGAVNSDYDGSSNIELLSASPELPVGESGIVTIALRIDTTNGGPAQGNTAVGNSDELSEAVPSNDPTVTPNATNDINPTPLLIIDTDGDGVADNLESASSDRDGDGIPDSEDYDPTGYFYCEETGDILLGGGISVSGPAGSNSSIGTSNNIVIVEDGRNGFYQFYVTAPGRYTLTPTYPTSGVPSIDRPVEGGVLDATSLLPQNPGILGSSENRNTGTLADASLSANPAYYFEFDFEAGDPAIFMNNIPLRHCGSTELTLVKSIIGDVVTQGDGRQMVTYEFEVSNTGQTQVDAVQITDDLGDVFGDNNVIINANDITDSPTDYADVENGAYDGVTDINLLEGFGSLKAGEILTVQMQAIVSPETASAFINRATLQGANPLTGNLVIAEDRAVIELIPAAKVSDLIVRKTARPRTVQIGDPVLYTIDVTNSGIGTISNIDIVDFIPEGFAYVPQSASLTDGNSTITLDPTVAERQTLRWNIAPNNAEPLNSLSPGETISVNLRLLAGPNVEFGAHENQAFTESLETGERSDFATAIVDYIPEPSFDCTPVIGRVYDDVNHNGYPDDGEPGLPAIRLVTVNGDIITTDEYGRYHIPCAVIANSERGSNFLLKADTRTFPLGYSPTTENPRVVRATRGKFVKMNFGAAHRPKLRIDLFASDFSGQYLVLSSETQSRLRKVIAQDSSAERAIIVYHADELENVDESHAALRTGLEAVKSLASGQFSDIALEASWGDAKAFVGYTEYEETENGRNHGDLRRSVGQVFDGPADQDNRDRVAFFENENGQIQRTARADEDGDEFGDEVFNREEGLRGEPGSRALANDNRRPTSRFGGRRDSGNSESARPGRLLRWVGWGNTTTSYAESMEIETTVSSLDLVKRLDTQADIVSTPTGRVIKAEGYWNYDAFIERAELRVFDALRSTRGTPLATVDFAESHVAIPVSEDSMPVDMVYVLRVYGTNGDFDETAPKRLRLGDAEHDLTEEEWQKEAYTAFGQNSLIVDSIRMRGGAVRVYGRNVPGDYVTVMGQSIAVDEDGKFVTEQLLPSGEQNIEVVVDGENGSQNRILRNVDVKTRDTFYVAQIEATIGETISEDSTGDRSFEDGRVAFYLRSRLNDRWSLTATADTGEAAIDDLFDGLDDKDLGQLLRRLDPERYYPTYGDDSVIEQDAPTSGRFYVRFERDDDYALWGNYQTNFNDTEFGRVQRTLYGAKLHWDENGNQTVFGDDRTRLTAYIAEGGSRQGRDEFQGTGGSVYYLRNGDIGVGSEIVRIETRDSVSDLVIESRRLTYGTDYDLDFIQGRVILNQPLASTSDDGRLFRDGSQSGNETILVVDYEYTPIFGDTNDAAIYGARASRWFGDHIKIGGTYNHDTDGGVESDLYGVDLTLQYEAGTYIKAEFARTEGQGVETFRSIDGGFTFNALDTGGQSVLSQSNRSDGYAIEAAVDFAEVDGINLDGNSYVYWRRREAGFAGFTESTNQTIEQFGGGLDIQLAEPLRLSARADVTDERTSGTNSFAEARLDYDANEHITASVGVSFSDDIQGNGGTSIGGRIDYAFNDDTKIYAFGQVGLTGENTRTTDRIGAGGEVRLSSHILGGGEISTGEDGLGARASLRYQYDNGDEYYLSYDLPLRSNVTADLGTFNFGARRRYTDALSVYGEERLQFNDRGLNGLTHAYGIDYTPGNWNLGLSGEVGTVDDLDRTAFSANIGFGNDRIKAGITGEWREDENVDTGDQRETWLLRTHARYLASEELRLQAKLNFAFSDQSTTDPLLGPQSFNEAEFTEASIAAAYRPIWDDRFNLLAKLVLIEDLSPTSQRFNGETLDFRQKSEIASIDASYDISERWTLGGKYAYRSGSVTSDRESDDFTESEAQLGIIRLDFHATHEWDAVLEGRILDISNGTIRREGGLAGIYRHVNDNAKIGAGITWGGIEEEYLAAQDDDELGWFINVIGKF